MINSLKVPPHWLIDCLPFRLPTFCSKGWPYRLGKQADMVFLKDVHKVDILNVFVKAKMSKTSISKRNFS